MRQDAVTRLALDVMVGEINAAIERADVAAVASGTAGEHARLHGSTVSMESGGAA